MNLEEVEKNENEEINVLPRVKLYYSTTISYAHQLENAYTEKCKHLHGHTAKVEIWISGLIDPRTGMLVDFGKIRDVVKKFDHVFLNQVAHPPTTEMLAHLIVQELLSLEEATRFDGVKVRVWEGENKYVEIGEVIEILE